MKVLIVDDEIDIGRILNKILSQKKIDCEVALNIKDARERLKKHTFDLCFLDINLPDGSGFELVGDLRENNSDGEIVMVSAYDGEDEREMARSSGINTFISKPFSKKEILNLF